MKTVGIIAEYNPFHNGHKFHIHDAKKLTGADYCIVVMCGNFVQRGAPAMIDKYARTKMALLNGADLVIELPVYYAVSSAENFAAGAVSLLDRLGVVNAVCFGSECGDVSVLSKFAGILAEESSEFSEVLKKNLKDGLSYPVARNNAFAAVHKELTEHLDVLSSPNNILGIEYIKSLIKRGSTIQPYASLRTGSDYHDASLLQTNSSATAIRHSLEQMDNLLLIANKIPSNVYQIMEEHFHVNYPIYQQDLSLLLKYKLLLHSKSGYTDFVDITDDLSDKIRKNLESYTDIQDFCELLHSKDLTYTRISRCLLHILLDIKKDTLNQFIADDYVYYARILGLRQSAFELLNAMKRNASLPLISKLADAKDVLKTSAYATEMLNSDIFASHIYDAVATDKFHTALPNEYRRQIVKVR